MELDSQDTSHARSAPSAPDVGVGVAHLGAVLGPAAALLSPAIGRPARVRVEARWGGTCLVPASELPSARPRTAAAAEAAAGATRLVLDSVDDGPGPPAENGPDTPKLSVPRREAASRSLTLRSLVTFSSRFEEVATRCLKLGACLGMLQIRRRRNERRTLSYA